MNLLRQVEVAVSCGKLEPYSINSPTEHTAVKEIMLFKGGAIFKQYIVNKHE
jgi:hypothetical protein